MNYNEFIDFLIETETQYLFTQNLYFKSNQNVKEYIGNTETEYLIEDGFRWAKTEEGFAYWDSLNDKLKTKLKEIRG